MPEAPSETATLAAIGDNEFDRDTTVNPTRTGRGRALPGAPGRP